MNIDKLIEVKEKLSTLDYEEPKIMYVATINFLSLIKPPWYKPWKLPSYWKVKRRFKNQDWVRIDEEGAK